MNHPLADARDLAEAWAHRSTEPDWADQAVSRFRDLLLMRTGDLVTVVACDSNAGIGDQPADVIRQSPRLTGYGAAKVPLMEILAAGATPAVLINTLGNPLTGIGKEILAGIQDCLDLTGHRPVVTGSDETNVATVQTSIGITVIGIANSDDLLLGRAQSGDLVVVLGEPKDGIAVQYEETDPDIATPREVAMIVAAGLAHELLPVGSRGIAYEAAELARAAHLEFTPRPSPLDLAHSAGSSTCLLLATTPHHLTQLTQLIRQPLTVVGELHSGLSR